MQRGTANGLAIEGPAGGELVRVSDDSVWFLPDGHAWRVRAVGGAARALALIVPPGWIEHACDDQALEWRPGFIERAPRIAGTLRWIRSAVDDDALRADALVDRLLARLLATTFGGLARRADDSWLPAVALGRISALVAGGSLQQLTIASLAADAGLGVSAFSRSFRGSTGLTPGDHLIAARLDRVASMLGSTDLPLAEIARGVGLSSVAHVSQQFHSRHGVSARRYRASRARETTPGSSEAHPGDHVQKSRP